MATVSKSPKSSKSTCRAPSAYSQMTIAQQIAIGIQQVRDHAAGKIKLKTTTVSVPAKARRVAAKKAARPSRSRKPA